MIRTVKAAVICMVAVAVFFALLFFPIIAAVLLVGLALIMRWFE